MDNQNKILSLRKLKRVGYDPKVDGLPSEFGSNSSTSGGSNTNTTNSNNTTNTTNSRNFTQTTLPKPNNSNSKIAQVIEQRQQAVIQLSKDELERIDLYKKNGLEYINTLPFVTIRDSDGNISLREVDINDESNQKIIIEPNSPRYLNESVINIIDTQFKYFSFPPNIITRETPPNTLNIDLASITEDLENFEDLSNKIIELLEKSADSQDTTTSGNSNNNSDNNNNNSDDTITGPPTLTIRSLRSTRGDVDLTNGNATTKKSYYNNRNFLVVEYEIGNIPESGLFVEDGKAYALALRGVFIQTNKLPAYGKSLYTKGDNTNKDANFIGNITKATGRGGVQNAFTYNTTTQIGTWGAIGGQPRIEMPNDQKKDGNMSIVLELGKYFSDRDAKDFTPIVGPGNNPIRFQVDKITISK